MALTRKLLKGMQLSDEVIEMIIEAHSETVTGLKERIETLEQQVGTIPDITRERDELKQKVETLTEGGDKAAEVQAAFDAYKAEVEGEKTRTAKRTALDALLRDRVGIHRDEARQLILEAIKTDDYELDESGGIRDADAHAKTLGDKYAAFVGRVDQQGTKTITPPSGGGGAAMSKNDIMAIRDPLERQTAIAQNLSAFGKE